MVEPMVPLRALEHHAYCKRKAAIIHVDGVWRDNEHTVRGVRGHRRVDHGASRTERGRMVLRGVELWSETLGLVGRADAVEILPDGSVEPVEYKHGIRHGRNAEIQLCAQALCLEEMLGVEIRRGHVWYAGLRRRQAVDLDEELRQVTLGAIDEIRTALRADRLPEAPNDARCRECQLRSYCVPELVADPQMVMKYMNSEVLMCR